MTSNVRSVWPLDFTAEQLGRVPSVTLKSMSRVWGGKGNENMEACVRRILHGLADVNAVRAAVSVLTPEERAALAILKEYGGMMQAGVLEDMLRAYGYAMKTRRQPGWGYRLGPQAHFASHLLRRGFLLLAPRHVDGSANYGDLRHGDMEKAESIYTDARILAQVDWSIEVRPLAVTPLAHAPLGMTARRPQHVTLDLFAVARALTEIRQLTMTKAGLVRLSDMRKLAKSLGWAEQPRFDGHLFRSISAALVGVWLRLDWLRCDDNVCTPTITPERFAQQPLMGRVSHMAHAFVGLKHWSELGMAEEAYGVDLIIARSLLLHSLRALPDMHAYYAVPAFMAGLQPRVGHLFQTQTDYAHSPPVVSYSRHDEEYEGDLAAWKQEHAAWWVTRESAFVAAAFSSWMYWLGLLELGEADGALVFRLTDIGRAVVSGDADALGVEAPVVAGDTPAWVVQPNYDVVVYLDAIAPAQLAFIEGHAERRQAEAHTAHYQLTRESIYRGLEGGTDVETVLATLSAGMGAELPRNVAREIREWAGHREQLTVYTSARLIEFPSTETREQAMESGLKGTRVGETFVLIAPGAQVKAALKAVFGLRHIPTVDYAAPPTPCLEAREDGTLLLVDDTGDLLLRGQLARCAEVVTPKTWRITPASLTTVRQAGVSVATLLAVLQPRVIGALPPLLDIAIRNALGARQAVQGEMVVAVRVSDKKLYTALTTSPTAKRLLLDVPGPDTLLLATDNLEAFKALLQWLGVKLTPLGGTAARPDWLQTVRDARSLERRRYRY